MTLAGQAIDVIVLAGDRGPADPLAVAAGAPGKVLVEIDGRSLLNRVLETVAQLRGLRRVLLVAPEGAEYRKAIPSGLACIHLAPEQGPAASVAAGLKCLGSDAPVLVVTADHPLLCASWLEGFVADARGADADAAVGVADAEAVLRRFPGMRRTSYRFADLRACGTNVFWLSGPGGARVATAWAGFERDRKRPWRMIARLGTVNLLRYALGRVTLAQAMQALSARCDARLVAVVIDAPEAAVDVDSPDDLDWVRAILAERGRSGP